MIKRNYIGDAFYCLTALKKHLILYIPDLIFFIGAFILAYLFLNMNHITSIFGGSFTQIESQTKTIFSTTPLLLRLIGSFVILLAVYLILGLGTITARLIMIAFVIKNEEFSLSKGLKAANRYLFPLLWLKIVLLFIYALPALILIGVGIFYKPFLLFAILLVLFLFVLFRFIFMFIFIFVNPTLFLGEVFNPLKIISSAVNYFLEDKIHSAIVCAFTIVIGFISWGIFTSIPLVWSQFNVINLASISSLIYLVVKTLVDISVNLWSTLFIFKNY